MNEKDVFTLLVYCNELDGRHSPNAIKVAAWMDVFSETAKAMPLKFAQNVARTHYSKSDVMIAPNVFVREWHKHESFKSMSSVSMEVHDRHCRRVNCPCTHQEPCYRGWIDRPDNTATAPCKVCNLSLAMVLATIPPPGLRTSADFAKLDARNQHD